MSSEPLNHLEPTLDSDPKPGERGSREAHVDDVIEASLELLVQQGARDDPESLREFLPQADSDVRHYVLIELIKLNMAMAAESGPFHRIERYIDAMPEMLAVQSIPLDLVMEEIQLRRDSGESPSSGEYAERFPQFVSMFGQLSESVEATSAVANLGAPPEQPVGSQIDDFLIIQKLGKGAFAHVYLARQLSMHRLVALKVSRGKGDEPRALAQFDHPNIVRVFDQRAIDDQQLHLLYMQFHPGGTVADVVAAVRLTADGRCGDVLLDTVDRNLLRSAQVVPDRSSVRDWVSTAEWPTVVAWIGVQLARALDDAHSRGVLHRDVKPANVLLSAEGIPKLADFNVSFAGVAGRAGAATSFGGSIGYMSPEHLRAISAKIMDEPAKVQEPADLYSLGILLWELWQGNRPFTSSGVATSWTDAVAGQLASRQRDLVQPQRVGTASERVLEKALRAALAHATADRPASGADLAGSLRLALHPDAASLFDPGDRAIRTQLAQVSPWLVAATAILLPHIVAGVFNLIYNLEILDEEMQKGLSKIAIWVNLVAVALAVPILIWYTRGMARAVRMANEGSRISSEDVSDTVDLGHRAALIGGAFWMVAGIVYPLALWWMYPAFTPMLAVHFFVSLLICGGVAMTYPFFSLALMSTLAFYPRLMRGTLRDPGFDLRAHQMVRRSEAYLLVAAIIPMLGAALLVSSQSQSSVFMLIAIAMGMIGLLGSFLAFLVVSDRWTKMGKVLSTRAAVVPGENESAHSSRF